MAVETTTAFSGPYTANGATTTFGFTFIAKAADEIGVLLRNSDGVDSVVSTSAYTVTLNANGTGSVVFTTAPATGNSVYIYSDVSFQHSIDFEDGTGWKAAPVNETSDRAALRDIWLKNKADRGIVVPVGETGFTLPAAAEREGYYLAFDADGDATIASGTGADAGLRTDLAANNGSALAGFIQAGTGATARTAQAKMRDIISAGDFGAAGDGNTTDQTALLQAALTKCGVAGDDLLIPDTGAYYKLTDSLTVPDGVRVFGAGHLKQTTREKNVFELGNNCTVEGLKIEGDGVQGAIVSETKNIGVYANAKRNVKVLNCTLFGHEGGGVFFRSCKDIRVESNYFYLNNWDGVWLGPGPSVADISIYSSAASGRVVIQNNICLSNNSQNIYMSPTGLDSDAIVSGNICDTLDSNFASVASGGVKRHSIVAGYTTNQDRRVIVSNNICRNTKQCGVYAYSPNTGETGPMIIEGNLCIDNGYDTTVDDLVGGVLVGPVGACPAQVIGNYVVDFKHDQGGAITQTGGHALIEGNVVVRSSFNGIAIIASTDRSIVRGNVVRACTDIDIRVEFPNSNTNNGGVLIEDNDIERSTGNKPMVRSILGTGYTGRSVIRRNSMRGVGANSDDGNIGIAIQSPIAQHDILDNDIRDVKWGVNSYNYITSATRYFNEFLWDGNRFTNCGSGSGGAWGVGATATTTSVPVERNIYVNCNAAHAGGSLGGSVVTRDAQREGDKINVFKQTAAPTTGTWAVGDYARNHTPSVGQPKAWACTVAGNPGTWTSEGVL